MFNNKFKFKFCEFDIHNYFEFKRIKNRLK